MKKMLLTIAFVLIAVNAHAFIPDIAGCVYSDGGAWYEDYANPTQCGTSFIQGSNIAHEFNIYETLNLNSIETMMVWNGDERDLDQPGTLGANMVIYEGSIENEHYGRTPSNNRIFEQSFSIDESLDTLFSPAWHGVSNVRFELNPGNYWLGVEDGTRYLFVSGGPRFGEEILATMHTPEPSTLLLFGLGLLAFMIKKHRAV